MGSFINSGFAAMAWRTVEVVALALLLLIWGTRLVVAFLIQVLFVVAVVAGTVSYVLAEVGVL